MTAKDIVNKLLEYGKIDYGQDEYGRTRWKPELSVSRYWVSPEGSIERVSEHIKWAQQNVLPGIETGVIPKMQELGWLRATSDQGMFSINVDRMNEAQRAAVERFVKERHLKLQHLMIA